MRATIMNDYFWIYIVAGVIFFGISIYLMPKLIRFLDKSADKYVEKKVKKRDGGGEEKKRNRYKTF